MKNPRAIELRAPISFGIFAASTYLLLSSIKMRDYLTTGRFWAEEGAIFYAEIVQRDLLGGILFIFNSHLELCTNIIVYFSTLVDIKYAPLITTYLSFGAQFIPIYFIIKYRTALRLSHANLLLLLVIAVGLPQASEVWANSINLHFHFSWLVALIAAIKISEGPPKWLSRLLLIMAGLSGVPPNFLTPVFAYQAIVTKERERWLQFSILLSTSLIQVCLLLFNDFESGKRNILEDPYALWLAPIAQSVFSPLFGFTVGDQLANILILAKDLKPGALIFATLLSAPLAFIAYIAIKARDEPIFIITSCAFILMGLSIATSLGEKSALISAAGGGRYFYAPNILLAISFLIALKKHNVFTLSIVAALTINSAKNTTHYLGGPPWISNFETPKALNEKSYKIWPNGWRINLAPNDSSTK